MMVDGLLEFSRLGKNQLERTAVDLSALALDVGKQIARNNSSVEIVFDIEPGLIVEGDWRILRIMLQNLFENSAKYHRGSRVCISFGRTADGSFLVRDDGIGFDNKFAEAIFQPFHRLHRDVDYPGTGIGLANVRRIVERHGGTIWAEGTPRGGACFYFTLGIDEARKAA